jgi:lysophospholipase L1-like esterase
MRFYNRGSPGDTTEAALGRFDSTVPPLKPTIVFTCFGINEAALLV